MNLLREIDEILKNVYFIELFEKILLNFKNLKFSRSVLQKNLEQGLVFPFHGVGLNKFSRFKINCSIGIR